MRILAGSIVVGFVGLIIGWLFATGVITTVEGMSNNPQQLSLEELQDWVDDMGRQVGAISNQANKVEAKLITMDVFAREWVWTIRSEIDNWNRAGENR